jgi:predicted secreted protein
LNSAEVHKQIRTAFWSDKTKTFLVVKPLDGAALTVGHFLISLELELMTASFT